MIKRNLPVVALGKQGTERKRVKHGEEENQSSGSGEQTGWWDSVELWWMENDGDGHYLRLQDNGVKAVY